MSLSVGRIFFLAGLGTQTLTFVDIKKLHTNYICIFDLSANELGPQTVHRVCEDCELNEGMDITTLLYCFNHFLIMPQFYVFQLLALEEHSVRRENFTVLSMRKMTIYVLNF